MAGLYWHQFYFGVEAQDSWGSPGSPSQAKIDFGDLGTPSQVGSLAFNPKIKLKAWSGWIYWSPLPQIENSCTYLSNYIKSTCLLP